MARIPLIHIPNGMYSVVSKCNNNEFHFNSDEKFSLYLEHLSVCKEKMGFKLYDLCCMSNHVHELYEVPEEVTIAQILQQVKGRFSYKFNRRFDRKDHFWKNKAFYRLVQDERYAITSCSYYHNNPVKAGMVSHPSLWPYSGYRFHVMGERRGILGTLLDPLPGTDSSHWSQPNPVCAFQTAQLMQRLRFRFIGDPVYIKWMREQHC